MISHSLRAALAALALVLAAPAAARAEPPPDAMILAAGEGELVRLSRQASSVFVAAPDIADIQAPSPGAVFVMGKRAGTTTLIALDRGNHEILRRTVVVRHNVAEFTSLLHQRFPEYRFTLASAPGSLMVSGTVDNADDVTSVVNTLKPLLGKEENLINRVSTRAPTQVYLRVRVAEVTRELVQEFGVNWQALSNPGNFAAGLVSGRDFIDTSGNLVMSSTGASSLLGGFRTGNQSILGLVDALDKEGLLSVLAEPNLTALSGQTASFLAGGEFPIPVAQDDNTISIAFKPFGVALDFTPTVLSSERISLTVRPEISEISTANSITLDNLKIPGLTVRRVETTVELSSGQSFAIGGLLQDNTRDLVSRVPGLGDLPVLGKLFSSKNYQNNKTELVVIVTPYVVRPSDPKAMRDPLHSLQPASDVEFLVQNRLGLDPLAAKTPRLIGSAGFIY